jgi:hypothetical protein
MNSIIQSKTRYYSSRNPGHVTICMFFFVLHIILCNAHLAAMLRQI